MDGQRKEGRNDELHAINGNDGKLESFGILSSVSPIQSVSSYCT